MRILDGLIEQVSLAVLALTATISSLLKIRATLLADNVVLRHQISVLRWLGEAE